MIKQLICQYQKANNLIKKWADELNGHCFQKIHTGAQQTHKKMLNITNLQGYANQNHNEMLPCTSQNAHYQKINVGENIGKMVTSCTVGGNISHYGKWYGVSSKIKKRTTILFSNSTSGYLSKEKENINLKRYMHPLCSLQGYLP